MMTNRIILPGGQNINPDNTKVLQTIINKMDRDHKERLMGIRSDLHKLDSILQAALRRNEKFEKKLKELGVDPKELIDG